MTAASTRSVRARLQADGPLPDRRQHRARIEHRSAKAQTVIRLQKAGGMLYAEAEAIQAGESEDGAGPFGMFVELTQTGADVAADLAHAQVRAGMEELALPPQAA